MTKGGQRKGAGRPEGTKKNLGSKRKMIPEILEEPIDLLIKIYKNLLNNGKK